MIEDALLVNDWHPVASLEDLADGGLLGLRLLDEDIVLWRSSDQVMVWQDLCLHRGTRLSLGKVADGLLTCPYHGWTYDPSGRCVRIPAHPNQTPPTKAVAKTYQVQERYGLIWVSLGQPEHDVPPFPQWADANYHKVWCKFQAQASGPRLIENFLDVAHLPFVHEGILGDRRYSEIPEYEAEIGQQGVQSGKIGVYQPSPYGDQGGIVFYTYRAFRPLTAHFLKESTKSNYAILLTITPHEILKSTAWMCMATTFKSGSDEEMRLRLGQIFGQDQPIVESQRPELLPLDLQAELHLRSDRMAIAYRKWLNQLGLSFGTA